MFMLVFGGKYVNFATCKSVLFVFFVANLFVDGRLKYCWLMQPDLSKIS